MGTSRLTRLWEFLTGIDLVMGLLWIGLAAFSFALIVLIWTRWGQYRPLRKCLLLSLLAHLLLAGYATTVEIVALAPADGPVLHVAYIDGPVGPGIGPGEPGIPPMPSEPERVQAAAPPPADPRDASPKPADARGASSQLAKGPVDLLQPTTPPTPPPPPSVSPPAMPEPPIAAAEPVKPMGPSDTPATEGTPEKSLAAWTGQDERGPEPAPTATTSGPPHSAPSTPHTPLPASNSPPAVPRDAIPDAYKLRVAPDHEGIARGGGGSPETEAAVRAAHKWLADNQSPDGRWDASQHEAGRGTGTDGRDRRHAGLEADTGMTGLALLTFLAAGETHMHGVRKENVRRGLEFLLQSQDANGSLGGHADSFALMYCHAMAAFALSEAYGMTGDQRLEQAVRRAVGYTVACQDPQGGGWRYRPRDPGDTSQLGWQFMALKSAELAGIPIPNPTRQGIIRYLRSVASGNHGGLASYRPLEQATRTMTAEALVCWQFLGLARENPACNEAGDWLLAELPGMGRENFYYWYYGTLAMHQLQGEHWRQWNDAMRTQLLKTQRTDGPLAGSWDPDPVWGGYGGRIYSSSLAALCLEVYYRYLPLYRQADGGREKEL
jgi:hypothetical protein